MTIEEYARKVSESLIGVNHKEGMLIIKDVEEVLKKNEISAEGQKKFWSTLHDDCSGIVVVIEKQDGTAVNAIIASILAAIQNKAK